ncbi:eukaryotic translation initiation factor 2 beta subunit [Novymonas esmeraldas]|uniref:Eukaryotic translation initiation factor 2 beta subunit n=1 Tax=Novymonas esmeraldas TaxID=1808958 RepID=A0AAW0F6E1_9TRYP
MPRETGRQRRRNADSDESSSEDEEQQQTTTTTTTTTVTAPEAPTAPAAVTAPAPAPPARVRAKAPAAAAVSAPSMTLHADPAAAAAAAGEKEEDSGSDDDEEKKEDEEEDEEDEEESVMDEAAAAAAAQMRQLAEEMAAVDYETLTYAALLEILKRASRPQLEETMAQREQLLESAVQQQQNERVERFLDMMGTSSPTAAAAAAAATAAAAADANGSSADAATAATEGYRYNAMLTRLFEALNRNNEGSAMTERNQLPVPILERMGKKKTVITNFGRICDAFHRPMEDVKDFIEKELSIRGNLDSNSALILKLEIRRQTDFDRVLIKYLDEYVKCNSCHRINTTLTKDGRRLELRCNVCTATRTVTAAGTATFSAQIEKRSRQRAAMTL